VGSIPVLSLQRAGGKPEKKKKRGKNREKEERHVSVAIPVKDAAVLGVRPLGH